MTSRPFRLPSSPRSQSAFVRGFIDDLGKRYTYSDDDLCLNPRSCAASSMTPQLEVAMLGVG